VQSDSLTFFIVAGEASGDLHGSRLIQAIKRQHPTARFVGHGGDRMAAAGMEIVEHVNRLAIMGFTEVLRRLPDMLRVMRITLDRIETLQPQRVILIDYPGFNLRLARNVHRLGMPVTYFILPQVWAWREQRVRLLRQYIDQALCIFPFEEAWFRQRGVPAYFVGHPFVEGNPATVNPAHVYTKHGLNREAPLLILLPGSRQQEIDRHWDIFLQTVARLREQIPDLQALVGKAPAVTLSPIPDYLKVETEDVRSILAIGTAALVASGTATLEAAVADLPMVVCYRLSSLSWWLARRLARVPYAAMVNLITDRPLVPEFLQDAMQPDRLAAALLPLLTDTAARKTMRQGFDLVRRSLGLPGVYERAAAAILERTRG
jgi:lipid-A-disaccharide synthase